METKLGLFLLSTAGISLTGIMLPGLLTAATISKGYSGKNAGVLIAIGHAVIEIPLIAAIYFGFGWAFHRLPLDCEGHIRCGWHDAILPGFSHVANHRHNAWPSKQSSQ